MKSKILILSVISLMLISLTAYPAAPLPEYGKNGMVVSASELASQVGCDVLRAGGNAVDAAVATAFALGVVEQYSSGIGGGNFILVYLAKQDTVFAIDGRETAPMKAHRDMYINKDTGLADPELSQTGILAGGVPGAVASLCEAHSAFGSGLLPLADLLKPSIMLAEEGFEINRTYAASLEYAAPKLSLFDENKGIYFKSDTTILGLGDLLIQKDLAWSYRQIADYGPRAFYEGEIAEKIVAFEKKEKGLITGKDLETYQARYRDPIHGTYRGYDVFSMSPPSSGGIHLVQMLNILEGYNLAQLGHNSSNYLHILTETMKPAFADRAEFLGDPDFVEIPVDTLISKGYAEIRRGKIHSFQSSTVNPGVFDAVPAEGHTTHLSVMDKDGNMCAITATVNTGFGSGMTIEGTGIILNNEMDDFSAQPGQPNFFGLVGKEANSVQPGKRPLSSMTPTIVIKDGEGVMVLGSPGGPRIITAVLQTILNVIDFEMDIQEAVAKPRIHHQWKPDVIFSDPEIPEDVLRNLVTRGHRIYMGGVGATVEAIYKDIETGFIYGGADPRNEGKAVGY